MLDSGEELFTTEYLIEESLGINYFIASKGSKKGGFKQKRKDCCSGGNGRHCYHGQKSLVPTEG